MKEIFWHLCKTLNQKQMHNGCSTQSTEFYFAYLTVKKVNNYLCNFRGELTAFSKKVAPSSLILHWYKITPSEKLKTSRLNISVWKALLESNPLLCIGYFYKNVYIHCRNFYVINSNQLGTKKLVEDSSFTTWLDSVD